MKLIKIPLKEYQKHFTKDPHPFISTKYLKINSNKTDALICLVPSDNKYKMGLTLGMNKKVLKSPFSAPFGGFHFNNNRIYYSYINNFINALKEFIIKEYSGIDITMPPDYYNYSMNTKCIHSMICAEFILGIPEINNWIDLNYFQGKFPDPQVKRNLIKAKNILSFSAISDIKDKEKCFQIIVDNRTRLNREIHMNFNDILELGKIIQIDYFLVQENTNIVSSAIIYRINNNIVKVVFWGDTDYGRTVHAMDFLVDNLWKYYMAKDYTIIDVGTSTSLGVPNDGLIRYKENHGCHSSFQYHLKWRK